MTEDTVDSFELVDKHVGARVRKRRTQLHLSQAFVGEKIGVSFQQLQKYELGKNRISCGKLYYLAKLFDVDISYFFIGMPGYQAIVDNSILTDESPSLDTLRSSDLRALGHKVLEELSRRSLKDA